MNSISVAHIKRTRGAVLKFIYTGHHDQESRLDDTGLWGLMQDMQFDVGQNDVITVLQDLQERGYVNFVQGRNRLTNRVEITKIQITPKGRDLVEAVLSTGKSSDAAVVL